MGYGLWFIMCRGKRKVTTIRNKITDKLVLILYRNYLVALDLVLVGIGSRHIKHILREIGLNFNVEFVPIYTLYASASSRSRLNLFIYIPTTNTAQHHPPSCGVCSILSFIFISLQKYPSTTLGIIYDTSTWTLWCQGINIIQIQTNKPTLNKSFRFGNYNHINSKGVTFGYTLNGTRSHVDNGFILWDWPLISLEKVLIRPKQ